jgi:hypothetical protein
VAKRPRRCDRARSGRPAGGRRSRGCPDAGHAGRRPVRVLCPPCGCPSNRSRGRPVSMRPVSTRPVSTRAVSTRAVPSRCPDGRASGVRGSAAALSGPRWTLEWLGAPGRPRWAQWVRGAAVVRGRRGRLPAWGLTGRDGAGLAVGGSHEGRRQTWAAASQAHRLGRRLAAWPIRELVQRQGVGRLAGGHENTQVLTSSRQVCPGRVAGVVPDHGLDREVVTTLRGRWAGDSPVSSVPEAHPVRPGSRLRPQRGRGT